MYSVLVLTKNEEIALGGCLESIDSDDIWILDSESTDGTASVAASFGARFISRKFTNYADQRNFGLAFPFIYDWVLVLDADERLSIDFDSKICSLLDSVDSGIDIVSVLRRDYLWGRWLRGASGYPVYFPRLFRKGRVRVEREINELYVCEGEVLYFDSYINHEPFIKGISFWIERHNKYSSMEALTLNDDQAYSSVGRYFARRQKLKRFFYRMPFRPIVMFFYLYLFRFGFLAGRSGLVFCLLRSFYEFMISVKQFEIRFNARSLDD